jgi:uncharacterized oxidoreductase
MKTNNNTVLITGGGAGIGFQTARLLSEQGNHVIITGRNANTLEKAAAQLKNVTPIVSDVSKEEDVFALVQRLKAEFPALNIVINNAAAAEVYKLEAGVNAYDKASHEIHTNFISVMRLNELLLPLLEKQSEAAIVNVSSIVAISPGVRLPGYAASKAALHSYTQVLRHTLSATNVKVFELMPPLVNTEFSKEIGGENGMPPAAVAEALLEALATDHYEIHVGNTADLYKLFLSSPAQAFAVMNTRE